MLGIFLCLSLDFPVVFSQMSSRGSQECGSGGRKSAAKRRHLSCRQCDILLPDDFEFTRCQDCRGSHVWLMSSRGMEERSAGGRKSTAKRRHLSCRDVTLRYLTIMNILDVRSVVLRSSMSLHTGRCYLGVRPELPKRDPGVTCSVPEAY